MLIFIVLISEVKDELEERMAEIKKTAQKVRQKLKGNKIEGKNKIWQIYY